jgi:N6-adenosine-specific RNA methylase IME4
VGVSVRDLGLAITLVPVLNNVGSRIRGRGYKRQSQGIEQVLHAPLREHSRKPDEIAHRIELLVGEVPRVELFARTRRPGWTVWGDEIDRFDNGGDR